MMNHGEWCRLQNSLGWPSMYFGYTESSSPVNNIALNRQIHSETLSHGVLSIYSSTNSISGMYMFFEDPNLTSVLPDMTGHLTV